MAVRTITEILESVQTRLGEDTSDEAIAFVEDITDTLNDFESKTKDEADWKKRYEENDASWRKKYKDRFFGKGKPTEEEIEDDFEDNEEGEEKTVKTFEDLFKTE